jgi:hypothetical protein
MPEWSIAAASPSAVSIATWIALIHRAILKNPTEPNGKKSGGFGAVSEEVKKRTR